MWSTLDFDPHTKAVNLRAHTSWDGSSDSFLLWTSCCSSCKPQSPVCALPRHGWPWWLCSWHGWSSDRRGTAVLNLLPSGFSRCKPPPVFGIPGLQTCRYQNVSDNIMCLLCLQTSQTHITVRYLILYIPSSVVNSSVLSFVTGLACGRAEVWQKVIWNRNK